MGIWRRTKRFQNPCPFRHELLHSDMMDKYITFLFCLLCFVLFLFLFFWGVGVDSGENRGSFHCTDAAIPVLQGFPLDKTLSGPRSYLYNGDPWMYQEWTSLYFTLMSGVIITDTLVYLIAKNGPYLFRIDPLDIVQYQTNYPVSKYLHSRYQQYLLIQN